MCVDYKWNVIRLIDIPPLLLLLLPVLSLRWEKVKKCKKESNLTRQLWWMMKFLFSLFLRLFFPTISSSSVCQTCRLCGFFYFTLKWQIFSNIVTHLTHLLHFTSELVIYCDLRKTQGFFFSFILEFTHFNICYNFVEDFFFR